MALFLFDLAIELEPMIEIVRHRRINFGLIQVWITVWRIVCIGFGVVGFAVVAIGIAVSLNGPFRVGNTVFDGNETLAGFNNLSFVFHRDGRAGMIDAQHPRENPVVGRWQQNGDKVTLTFLDCVYEGTMKDKTLTGQGRFVQGPQTGHAWNFSVTYAHDRGAGDIP